MLPVIVGVAFGLLGLIGWFVIPALLAAPIASVMGRVSDPSIIGWLPFFTSPIGLGVGVIAAKRIRRGQAVPGRLLALFLLPGTILVFSIAHAYYISAPPLAGPPRTSYDSVFSSGTVVSARRAWSSERGEWSGGLELIKGNGAPCVPSRLTNGNDDSPTWSHNGRKVAFVRSDPTPLKKDVYVINADSSGLKRLTHQNVQEIGSPRWSPNDERIVVWLYSGDNAALYVINVDGTGEFRLTPNDLYVFSLGYAWSPDNNQIVFLSSRWDRGTASYFTTIYIVNADGAGLRRLTDNDAAVSEGNPIWSSDGRHIAFSFYQKERRREIHVINADGTGELSLTDKGGQVEFWSPAGNRIVFERNGDIWAIGIDGSRLTRLTKEPLSWLFLLPDGRIAGVGRSGSTIYHSSTIYLASADGSGVIPVLTLPMISEYSDFDWSQHSC